MLTFTCMLSFLILLRLYLHLLTFQLVHLWLLFLMNQRLQSSSFLLLFSFSFYGWIETCCPDILHQLMCSPYSSFEHGLCVGLLFVGHCFSCGGCGVNVLGNVVSVYPKTVQGLMFYRSKI